ncbi:SusC/RagA family TonB-linked outer membrane protein [Parabacteroides chinchillae]
MLKNFKPVSLILFAGALCFSGNAYADLAPVKQSTNISQQSGKVTGTVEDALGPVTGASVVVKGTTNGTITDFDGNFTLEGVKKGDVIQISFIGYTSQEITYNGQPLGIINLAEDTQKLDEVVVTALGIKREKKALGYATQELKGDAILDSRESNVTNALSGKVSGLQVVRSSGGPGASSKIVLRGNNSITGTNQPLIVIDGIPMDNFQGGVADAWGNKGPDMGNGLSDINPEDIESMNVLKGASAAALYGSRAGNGVILITTKSGKKQSGLGITVNAGVTAETMFMQPDIQNSYGQGSTGIYDVKSRFSWGPIADGSVNIDSWNGKNVPMYTYDNVGNYFDTGVSFNEGISFQQANEGTSVFASINRSDDKGIVPGAKLSKTSINLRGTMEFGPDKRWKLDGKVNYLNNIGHNRPLQGINQSNAFSTIYNLPRSINILDLKDCLDEDGNMIWWDTESTPQENPYWTKQYRTNEDTRNRFLGTMSLSYKIFDWWNVELKGGTDYYTTTTTSKLYAGGNVTPKGNYSESSETFYENNFSFLTTAQKDNLLGKFGGFVTFGGNLMIQKRSVEKISTGDLLIPNLFSINNAVDKNKMGLEYTLTQRKMNSLYGSFQINYDGWMFLDITARNDWSSTMSKVNRSYFYPSVSLSAVISDMVQKNGGSLPEWMTFAKVRASFAEVGNDLDPYQLYTVYSMSKDPYGNPVASPGSVLFNPDVRSELIKSWEAGVDLKFLNNRLGIDFAWYKSNATRQLLDLPLDPFSGYSSKKINAGNIQNSGVELMAYADIFQNPKGFSWNITANLSFNRNKVIDLYEGIKEMGLSDGSFNDEVKVVAHTGGMYGDIYGKKFQRVESGADAGKIIVDAEGLPLLTSDLQYLGNQQPKCMLGITNTFNYKNISLSFLIDARIGGKIYSATTAKMYYNGSAAGTVINGAREEFVVPNSVTASGDGYTANNTSVTPQLYWQRVGTGNLGVGEAFLYDATNVRLRNLTLGYTFDKKLLAKTPLERLRLSFTANNLWMIASHLEGIDPESVSTTNTNATGIELGAAPTSRSYTFNVTVGF